MQKDSETFDYWLKLAKDDPAQFEQKRLEAIESFINSTPDHMKQRLRGLQWRIDAERRKTKNPLSSCVKIYNMMWDKVYGNDGLLEALDTLLTGAPQPQPVASKETGSADVVTFLGSRKS